MEDVDTVIITHGHYDHGGGLGAFFDHNDHAKVYIHKLAFGDYYSTAGKRMHYIGLDQHLRHHPQCILVENDFKIDDETDAFYKCFGEKLQRGKQPGAEASAGTESMKMICFSMNKI